LTMDFRSNRLFNGDQHLTVDQDLAVLSLGAEARRQVRHCSNRSVIIPALITDSAECGVALGDADPEADFVAKLAPFRPKGCRAVAHFIRHADGPHAGVWARQ